ncbi:beta-N-acetylhexosaminidase [Chitinibacter tainanensis]|uniref:beta-N-acetylhexosaminidase n=1 Tax=Chitinibacter tainanensis TaxID=230667 RepID=UPI00040C45BD|nr:beta-N-acetylhexosaminidase [Chitinibacter tainanensis]
MFQMISATLQAQLGQLVMVGLPGTTVDAASAALIREQRVGGFILFRRNIESPRQVAALCRQLQEINAEVSTIPLLIGIDQEGGMVMRIEEGMTPLPSPMAYASGYASHAVRGSSPADCEQLHYYAADELRQLGININFAPSLDINNNRQNPVIGVRSFGENAATVSVYGLAALRGIQRAGLAATAKHFPGHGDTATDSHYALPLVPHDRARLDSVELVPFKSAIAAGVDAIMTAHVVFPAIEPDPNTPATLSRAVLTGLLREELGFAGLIITDCLEMDAIGRRPLNPAWPAGDGTVQGAVQAIAAGADIALVSHTLARQQGAVAALTQAVKQGLIAVEQVEASVARILALKAKAVVQDWASLPREPQALQPSAALQLAAEIQAAGVEFYGPPLLPGEPVVLVTVELSQRTEIDEVALGASVSARGTLLPYLQAAGWPVHEIVISPQVTAEEAAYVQAAAAAAPQLVFQSYNATRFAQQAALIASLPMEKLTLIAGRNPYDLALAPTARSRGGACSNRPSALQQLLPRLMGISV